MKILYVCSINGYKIGISPIVLNQVNTLKSKGIDIEIYQIYGRGLIGYLKHIPKLRKYIQFYQPEIISAQYSYCGIISSLSTNLPVITTLWGSDVYYSLIINLMIKYFYKFKWVKTIVRSEQMKSKIGSKCYIIPNGVNITVFRPLDKKECRQKLGWDLDKKYVLFASKPDRKEKNFSLAQATIDKIKINSVKLKIIYNIDHSQIPVYLNAADVLLLTSKWEGSPNIVKEAMACNIPVVATKVGDIEYLFGNTEGYYYTDSDPDILAEKINYVLNNDIKPNGRQRIIDLKLDSESVANKLIQLYQEVLSK